MAAALGAGGRAFSPIGLRCALQRMVGQPPLAPTNAAHATDDCAPPRQAHRHALLHLRDHPRRLGDDAGLLEREPANLDRPPGERLLRLRRGRSARARRERLRLSSIIRGARRSHGAGWVGCALDTHARAASPASRASCEGFAFSPSRLYRVVHTSSASASLLTAPLSICDGAMG